MSNIYYNDFEDYNSLGGTYGYMSSYSLPEKSEEEKKKEEEAKKYEYTKEEMKQIRKESFPGNKFAAIFTEVNKKKDEDSRNRPLVEELNVEGDTFIFTTGVDPVDSGRRLYDRKEVIISNDNAITPLVGCNGSGKSTIIHILHDALVRSGYPVVYWDNLKDGGHNALEEVGYSGDFVKLSGMITSSEGENILRNSSKPIELTLGLVCGKYTRDEHMQPYVDTNHIFLLLDALDSGFSIDNICNIKSHFDQIIELSKQNNKHVYIIVAANSFEVARNCKCWDVQHSKYVEFGTNYEAYREFIIKSRERILKQWERWNKENKDDASTSKEE